MELGVEPVDLGARSAPVRLAADGLAAAGVSVDLDQLRSAVPGSSSARVAGEAGATLTARLARLSAAAQAHAAHLAQAADGYAACEAAVRRSLFAGGAPPGDPPPSPGATEGEAPAQP